MQIKDKITTGTFGIELGEFLVETPQAVSGLRIGQDAIEIEQATPDGQLVPRKVPGCKQSGEVTVTRGMDASAQFTDWISKTLMSRHVDSARRNITITALDHQKKPVRRIVLFDCWATSWTGPALDAHSAGPASEQVTIVFDDISVE
ncbi:phage tail protein [Nocardia sp. GCM10030253]|uniref:phage tail protein n=1 Tax=Nocardia sp. GCM10030253 TaxID=3273404 RepID=UPI0036305610